MTRPLELPPFRNTYAGKVKGISMVWLLLSVLAIMLMMELRIWRAVTNLIYRASRDRLAPAKHKD
jgi:hypothetical protein